MGFSERSRRRCISKAPGVNDLDTVAPTARQDLHQVDPGPSCACLGHAGCCSLAPAEVRFTEVIPWSICLWVSAWSWVGDLGEPAGLHFDHHQVVAVEGDHIQLGFGGVKVAADQAHAEGP